MVIWQSEINFLCKCKCDQRISKLDHFYAFKWYSFHVYVLCFKRTLLVMLCYVYVIKDDEQGIEDNVLVSELDKYLMFRLPAPKENSKLKGYYGPSMKNLKILKIYRNIRSFVIFARRQRLPHHQKSCQIYFVYTRFGDYRR